MNQKQINEEFFQEYETNIGVVKVLQQPKIETNLFHPYQYELSIQDGQNLVKELKKFKLPNLQCDGAYTKPVKYGFKLSIFLLGWGVNFSLANGVNKQEWDKYTKDILVVLKKYLGDVKMYIEKYTNDKKFQARFETYIKYKEMNKV